MTRLLLGALALACVPLLGACNPSDISALQASGVTPTLTPGTLTPQSMTAAGIPPATQAKITKGVAQVQKVATSICAFVPLAEGIANVVIASPASATVQGVANLTCRALASAPTFASLGSRRGELVKGHVFVGGVDVPVYGWRAR